MSGKHVHLVLMCALLWAGQFALAQPLINEFCAANLNDYQMNDGFAPEYKDWIELYNSTSEEMDIGGYWLSDDVNNPQMWSIPAGTTLDPFGFLVIAASGYADYNPDALVLMSANFKLRQTAGEDVVLSSPEGVVLEYYDFADLGPNKANHCYARQTDGSENWRITTNPTPGTSNMGVMRLAYAVVPDITPEPGFYSGDLTVIIDVSGAGGTIYYTTDGSLPNNQSAVYDQGITLSESTSIRAIFYPEDPDLLPSFVSTHTYLIDEPAMNLPVVCLAGSDLLTGVWSTSIKESVLEYFDTEGNLICTGHGETDEHGNDTNAYNQRGFDYVNQDEMGYEHHLSHAFFPHSERAEFQRLIFRAAGDDQYPQGYQGAQLREATIQEQCIKGELHLDCRSVHTVAVYFNGNFRGVYHIREKVDDLDYLKYYYGVSSGDVDYIKTWGGTWNEYGSSDDWNDLVADLESTNACDSLDLIDITNQIDIQSFTDFYIINSFLNNTRWLNWDNSWWHTTGENGVAIPWRYALWDLDSFGDDVINYTGIPNMSVYAYPCDFLTMGDPGGQGHIPLIKKLFESEAFTTQFVNRYHELLNTTLSFESLSQTLDSLENLMLPDMTYHCERWGGSVSEWQENVNDLRTFFEQRCDTIGALVDICWPLDFENGINFTLQIEGDGSVFMNGVNYTTDDTPANLSFDCTSDMNLEAFDGTDYFTHWEVNSGFIDLDDPANPIISFSLSQDILLTAHFEEIISFNALDKAQLQTYPNPADDEVHIVAGDLMNTAILMDISGRIMDQFAVNNYQFNVPVSHLPNGLYYVQIQWAEGIKKLPVVVSH
ncbi:MAG: CotH kinase family protein [Flavobacteriales bacterium]|nr:CotH kinase family protein [Flavobacteriales bacterium]